MSFPPTRDPSSPRGQATALFDLSEAPDFEVPEPGAERVYVVEDDAEARADMVGSLESQGLTATGFPDAESALEAATEDPPAVLVVAHELPGMDGLELSEEVYDLDPTVGIVVVADGGSEEAAQASFRLGVGGYLVEPVDPVELARVVRSCLRARAQEEYSRQLHAWLIEAVDRKTREVRDVSAQALEALVKAFEAKSPHFEGHSKRVAVTARRIAQVLELPEKEVEAVYTAGLLHDLGMIGVPDEVVSKSGELQPDERRRIEEHCRRGAEILEPMVYLGPVPRYVLEHHERVNGSGYPDGKEENEISLGGQIVGLAETWVALTEERSFRSRLTEAEAIGTLEGTVGTQFSGRLVAALRSGVVAR